MYLSCSGVGVTWQHVHDGGLSCSVWAQKSKNLTWRNNSVVFPKMKTMTELLTIVTGFHVKFSVQTYDETQSNGTKKPPQKNVPLRTQKEMFFVATFLALLREKHSLLPLYCFLRLLTTTTGF